MFIVRQLCGPRLKRGAHFQTGLVIPIRNRPGYLRRAWKSLQASDLSGTLVLALDDASDDPETLELLRNLALPEQPLLLMRRRFRTHNDLGENLKSAFDFLARHFDCDYFAVLDSDTLVRPHWLQHLRRLHQRLNQEYPRFLLTGFNAIAHRVKKNFPDHRIKRSFGGMSLLFARELYFPTVRSRLHSYLWDWLLVETCRQQNIPLLCSRPSVAQHIGFHGVWSKGFFLYDWALDYGLKLPLWIETPVIFFLRNAYIASWKYNRWREHRRQR